MTRRTVINTFVALALAAMAGVIGFIWGRSSAETKTITVELPSTKGSEDMAIATPKTTLERTLTKTEYIYVPVHDTVKIEGLLDTAAIVRDWALRRTYDTTFVADGGSLHTEFTLQYNRPQRFDWSFTPNPVEVTVSKPRNLSPYVYTGVNTLGTISIGGGIYRNHWGVGAGAIYDFGSKRTGAELRVSYKF